MKSKNNYKKSPIQLFQELDDLEMCAVDYSSEKIVKFLLGGLTPNIENEKIDQLLKASKVFQIRVDGYRVFISENGIATYDEYVAVMRRKSDVFVHVFAQAYAATKDAGIEPAGRQSSGIINATERQPFA